jgi:tetratricopeptide (TPR) repeat protein
MQQSPSKLKLVKKEWGESNQKAAKFWTKRISLINDINDAYTAMESFYHYFAYEDYENAARIIVNYRDNAFTILEPLGASFYRLGLLDILSRIILEVLEKIDNRELLERLYNIYSHCEWLRGNIIGAIILSNKCIEIIDNKPSEQSNINKLIATRYKIFSCFTIAFCNIELGDIEKAKNYFESSLDILEECNLIQIIDYFEDFDLDKHEKDCLIRVKNYRQIIKPYLSYVYACLDINKNEEVLVDLKTINASHSIPHKAYSMIFYGYTYVLLGSPNKAFKLYKQAIKFTLSVNYPQLEAKARIALSEMYLKTNEINNALIEIQKAIQLLKKINSNPDLAQAYFLIALIYQSLEEKTLVAEYRKKSEQLFTQMKAPIQVERLRQAFY